MPEPHCYTAFGLGIESNCPLPGFLPLLAEPAAQIRVHVGIQPPVAPRARNLFRLNWRSVVSQSLAARPRSGFTEQHDYCELLFQDRTRFVIDSAGREIWYNWPRSSSLSLTAELLAGPALGFAMRLQGTVCLHASVLARNGAAIALAAPSGTGKSTTTARLLEHGFKLLSDDILALSWEAGELMAQPGLPWVRLGEDTAAHSLAQRPAMTDMASRSDKRIVDLGCPPSLFQGSALPLRRLIVLRPADAFEEPLAENLPEAEALIELLANTYPHPRFQLPKSLRADELRELGALARSLPVTRLRYRKRAEELDDLCRHIAAQLAAGDLN